MPTNLHDIGENFQSLISLAIGPQLIKTFQLFPILHILLECVSHTGIMHCSLARLLTASGSPTAQVLGSDRLRNTICKYYVNPCDNLSFRIFPGKDI